MPAPGNEARFLIAAAKSPLDGFDPREPRQLLGAGLDWSYVLANAGKHGVAPLMHAMLTSHELAGLVPEQAVESLRNNYLSSLLRGKRLYQALAPTYDAFRQESIPMMLLKGGALAINTYDDFGLRPFSDLDILVKREHLSRCKMLFEENGFELVHGAYGAIPDERNEELGCEWTYVRDKSTLIELHWDLMTRLSPFHLDPESYWLDAVPIRFEGRECLAMGAEDQLIHLCLHQYKHHWEHLRDLTDVALLIDRHGGEIDWAGVAARASTRKADRCVYHTLSLAARILSARIPGEAFSLLEESYRPGVMARALEDMIAANIFEENMPRRFWELILVDDPGYRVSIIRQILSRPFPRRGEAAQFGRQKAHDRKGKIKSALGSLVYYRSIITAYPRHLIRSLKRRGR